MCVCVSGVCHLCKLFIISNVDQLDPSMSLGLVAELLDTCTQLGRLKTRIKGEIWEKWGATYGRNGCGGGEMGGWVGSP